MVANTAGGTATATVSVTVSPPGLYLVPGVPGTNTSLTVTFESRDAGFQNQFGFAIADSTGAVNGVAPGSDGYVQAVVSTGTVVFDDRTNVPGDMKTVTVPAGSYMMFFLAQNSTGADVVANNPTNSLAGSPYLWFPLAWFNPDHFGHMQRRDAGAVTRLFWEDQTNGGDNDFNDMVVRIAASR
jgi:hypothetical protein